ncbi:MAG TPA: dephospho-CoA kinase [Gemmatimonadales bacterium]|nr:dephospho-CoA kinase [Gemmatimonadales bacterium]
MLNVALTGNIASGKSTVARWFAEWGATVIDADQLVRQVQEPGSPVLDAIARRFGPDVLLPSGELDRAVLRRTVFTDPVARDALNAIVHPAVRARRDVLTQAARERGDEVVIHDIPLLFEAADPSAFDLVILVDAPLDTRRRRLMDQRGLPRQEADAMLAAQLPAEAKRARSDIVLDNAGSLDDLRTAARHAWREIRRRGGRAALDTPPDPE